MSVQSIYKAFGNKPALLKTVFDVAIAGDDEPVPMLQRAALSHVPIQLLVRAAAATDAEAARVWDQLRAERMTGMTVFARALHQEGQLRPDVSVEEAGDMLWTCNSPEVYELLVVQRGWTPERYGRWVADTLTAALMP